MIRTIAVMGFVVLALVFGLPWLILWTLITNDASFMYRVFLGALRITMRIAGIQIRVEGTENIPPGVCIFASNHASNVDPVALVPHIPRRVALLAKKEVFRIPILSKALY
ncbi:MAG: lysophospholipid acyltransferase family protein, partial [Candidatus Acidiferrales bacterium]